MERQEQSPTPSCTNNTGEQYQQLAYFLFAVVLRLEGLQTVRRPVVKRLVDKTEPEGSQDQHDQNEEHSSETTSTTSSVLPQETATSLLSLCETPSAVSGTGNTASTGQASQQFDSQSMKSHLNMGKPQNSVITDYKSDEDDENSMRRRSFCPCQIFHTSVAPGINSFYRLTRGNWLKTPSLNDNYSYLDDFFAPKIPRSKFNVDGTDQKLHEFVFEKENPLEISEWKRLKVPLLAEASGLYREALFKAHSAWIVEGVIYQAMSKIIVMSVLDNAIKIDAVWRRSQSGNIKVNRGLRRQKPRVRFDEAELQGKLEKSSFIVPRESTPFRPVPRQGINASTKCIQMMMDESFEEDSATEPGKVDSNAVYKVNESENKDESTLSRTQADIFKKAYPPSPPVPFKLRTSKPMCSRLLRKIVENHFSDDHVETTDLNMHPGITTTGDARADIPSEVQLSEKKDRRMTQKLSSSVETQTEETQKSLQNVDASIGATRVRIDASEEIDRVRKTETTKSQEMQTQPSLSVTDSNLLEVCPKVDASLLTDKTAEVSNIRQTMIHQSETQKLDEYIKETGIAGTQTSNQGTSVLSKLKTTIPQSSSLLRDVIHTHTSAADMQDTVSESMDTEQVLKDFRQKAESLARYVVRRAVGVLYVEKTLQRSLEEVRTLCPEPFKMLFDRNRPNMPDFAKQMLNLPTSTSTNEFQWSSTAFERAASSLAETTRKHKFNWTPYRKEEAFGPSRMSVTHQMDPSSITTTKNVENIIEDVYLSADSEVSDDDYLDAQSYSSEDAQNQTARSDNEATAIINDSINHSVALFIARDVIQRSLDRIDDDAVNFPCETGSKSRSAEELNWRVETDTLLDECVRAVSSDDHSYAKMDMLVDVGGKRGSDTTIETVTGSQGESGFSDANSSVSDIHIVTSNEDKQVISEIVSDIMKRAVSMVIDGVVKDWVDTLEIDEVEKFTTPNELSEERGISAASSYHSITSDETDITLLAPDEDDVALPRRVQDIPLKPNTTFNQKDGVELAKNISTPTEDSLTTLAFLKNQFTDVKALAARYQNMCRSQCCHDSPVTISNASGSAKAAAARVKKIPGSQTTADDRQLKRDDTVKTMTIQNREEVKQDTTDDLTVVSSESQKLKLAASEIRRTTTEAETVTTTKHMTSSSFDLASANSNKRQNTIEKKISDDKVRNSERVETHVSFWEKIGKRKKGLNKPEQPVKPETPTKKTIEKFEQIIATQSLSTSCVTHDNANHEDTKPKLQQRPSDKVKHRSKSKDHSFWKNSAFFAALKKPAPANDVLPIPVSQKDDEPKREIETSGDSSKNHEDRDIVKPEDIDSLSSDSTYSSRRSCDTLNDNQNLISMEASPDRQSSSELQTPAEPSKSEEEIKLWMEKHQRVKARTAMLLSKCAEVETFRDHTEGINAADIPPREIPMVSRDPSIVSSHDTGDCIFPFGSHAGGYNQPDLFNPDAHVAALDENEDWIGSTDKLAEARIVNMKESDQTLWQIDKPRVKHNEQTTTVDVSSACTEETVVNTEDSCAENATLEGAEALSDMKEQPVDHDVIHPSTVEVQSTPSIKEDGRNFDKDPSVDHGVIPKSTFDVNSTPSLIREDAQNSNEYQSTDHDVIHEFTTDVPSTPSPTKANEQKLEQEQSVADDAVHKTTIDVQTIPLPIKKKGKKFKLPKIFKKKKDRKVPDNRESSTSKRSSASSCLSRASSCLSRASEDTTDDSAFERSLGSDSWNSSSTTESGATLTKYSINHSSSEDTLTTDSKGAQAVCSHDSFGGDAKRSLRKRLFNFGGLKKSNKFKSSRHTKKQ